jgi:uncharacterized membrane protein YvbJ
VAGSRQSALAKAVLLIALLAVGAVVILALLVWSAAPRVGALETASAFYQAVLADDPAAIAALLPPALASEMTEEDYLALDAYFGGSWKLTASRQEGGVLYET